MIRISTKQLLKEWTTAQLSRPVASSAPSSARCRSSLAVTSHLLISRHAPFPSLSLAQTSIRYYSTLPDQTSVRTKHDVPPPSTSASKKLKVDLHPAPKKTSREASSNVTTPRTLSPSIQSKSTSSTGTPATPVASKISPGTSNLVRRDVTVATEHGIPAPPPEDASRLGRLWRQFVQLCKFYWSGLKMIFITHRRQAANIRRRVANAKAKGENVELSRWETRFLRTYDHDLVKLVPFVLTLVILEEALPLVVLYAPALLPSTCLLPSQRERIEAKRRAKQMRCLEDVRAELSRFGQDATASLTENGVKSLSLDLARAVSGLFSSPTWGPLFLLQRRIKKRLAYLSSDDALLVKEGLGGRLTAEELVEALEERGFIPGFEAPQHMREQLQRWLRRAHDDKSRLALVLQAAIKEPRAKFNTDI